VKKAIRDHFTDFVAMIALFVVAAGVGGYILANQRLRFPFVEDKPKILKAEFSTAQAVTPGQGQTVRVSGIRIGDIGKVELREGRGIVEFQIDPKYKNLIREDATALLRPKTALKDMFVEVEPGDGKVARPGWTMPVQNTLPDVNADEVFAALDADTRDYLKLLVSGAGQGLKGRGDSLNELFKRFEPTHRDLARVTAKVSERRQNLRRLVTNLNRLNSELATKDDELAQLVDSSSRVFAAFASQDTNITEAVGRLPDALRQTTETLGKVQTFADVVQPSLERLRPAVRKLDDANAALTPLAQEATPVIRERVRPFVRESRPLVRDLRPAARNLAVSTPDLTRSFVILNKLFNMLGFNENGAQGPEVSGRDEGYLYWIAWLGHNGGSLFSTSSNTGILRPIALQVSCASIKQTIADEPELEFLQGLTGALLNDRVCPTGG
jgi:phospholipid/cholesterol/gamma-HCH transport system substrate-binding protein